MREQHLFGAWLLILIWSAESGTSSPSAMNCCHWNTKGTGQNTVNILHTSALTINRKLELLLVSQPPQSTRAAITARQVQQKCKQSHIARFAVNHPPCFFSCLRLSQVGYHQDCTIAGRNWLRQAWGGSNQCDCQHHTLLSC